jgi:hypothetical protein
MGASEFDEWARYYAAEPFGSVRDNLHAGIIASVVVNALRKKGRPLITPSDFVLMSVAERRQQSLVDGIARLRSLAVRQPA